MNIRRDNSGTSSPNLPRAQRFSDLPLCRPTHALQGKRGRSDVVSHKGISAIVGMLPQTVQVVGVKELPTFGNLLAIEKKGQGGTNTME